VTDLKSSLPELSNISDNRVGIEANEKRLAELTKLIEEVLEHFEESQQIVISRIDLLHHEFTGRLDRVLERFANRPSWVVMLLFSGLSSLCVCGIDCTSY
jgi:hypothetical protein